MDLKNLLNQSGGQQPPALPEGEEQPGGFQQLSQAEERAKAEALIASQSETAPKIGAIAVEDPNVTTTEVVDKGAVPPTVMEAVRHQLESMPKAEGPITGPGIFSSHPISNFKLGKFIFEKGTLQLDDAEDAALFRKMLDGLRKVDPRSAQHVKEIDSRQAERLIDAHRSLIDRTGDSAGAKAALNKLRERTGGDVGTDDIRKEG